MRALVIAEHGGPEVLRFEDRPIPEPGPCEIRVAVKAVGLNHLDIWVRRGVEGHTFPLPIVPGSDVAGVVDALGPGARGVSPGDRVVLQPGLSCGTCLACRSGDDPLCRDYGILGESLDGGSAELVVVPEANVVPMPERLDFPEAAAVPLTFLTAWRMLVGRIRLRPGQRVLIHAAGSGVSSAAIQIAALQGARVIATAGTDEKCRLALDLGADHAVNYRAADFVVEVRRWSAKQGVEVAVDHTGAENFNRTLRCLAKGGKYITCGSTSGHEMKTDFRLVFFKSLSILGSTMGGSQELLEVLRLIDQGRLRPVVDRVMPLEQIGEAHRHLESRSALGKTVLTLG
jgi:NADPH:quinone reductase-like Zn-dependent oxidoreductase